MHKIRVRFAPSPTGQLHIGGLRTALFNWLFAKHNNGSFLLRIEDTDIQRSRSEYTQAILEGMQWTNLMPDEPYVLQSDFVQEHKNLINRLIQEGKAYRCYCPADSVQDGYIKYDKRCRIVAEQAHDRPYVIRIKLPDWPTIEFHDLIRGVISFPMDQFDDFIIARSDGTPIYNFVVVADDIAMGITHVIRGEDHISNTPKQLAIYHALGVKAPQFAHLPLILNEHGSPLSKRDAATSVLDYKQQGYLPDALCNYLVRLGWSHGDQEIFSRDELVTLFTLEAVGKKGSVFDIKKLNWINHVYMQKMSDAQLLNYIIENIEPLFLQELSDWSLKTITDIIALYKERVETLKELIAHMRSLYSPVLNLDTQQCLLLIKQGALIYVQEVVDLFATMQDFTAENIKAVLKNFIKQKNIKLPEIAQPIRIALTATTASPGIFELAYLLGKKETIARINRFIAYLQKCKSEGI